ncbi:hypothetical protein NARC_40131 [Candidatus Nitrosocosmicus arcticus]|uniref:Uncharacterized protein n=1 Tax=Candidatus Nitrosocosmicus arcticus TaxID=2035267 RepID=A0A557SX32_9ARCH|nr:hypothetical protein NARC_40131 [Candidatus Nitrosocosmicus arcticus]
MCYPFAQNVIFHKWDVWEGGLSIQRETHKIAVVDPPCHGLYLS